MKPRRARPGSPWPLALLLGLAASSSAAQDVAPAATPDVPAALGETLSDSLPPPTPAGASGRHEVRAQLVARRYTTLAAEIGARIKRLPVEEAGRFEEGAVLAEFDCSVQRAALAKARAELDAAARTLQANERLAELNSVGQLELDLARNAVTRAQAEVGLNDATLAKCTVRAPFAGRVAEQKVREQQYAQPGQPLLEILDDSQMELEALVPSAWLVWLAPGLPLTVSIDETGRTYPARFVRIGARVDPVSQSVKVAAVIEGQHPELIAGMSGRIEAAPPP